jgi:hypothetical protein
MDRSGPDHLGRQGGERRQRRRPERRTVFRRERGGQGQPVAVLPQASYRRWRLADGKAVSVAGTVTKAVSRRYSAVIGACGAAIAAALFAAQPAFACHRLHVWKYPYPQRCSVTSVMIDERNGMNADHPPIWKNFFVEPPKTVEMRNAFPHIPVPKSLNKQGADK